VLPSCNAWANQFLNDWATGDVMLVETTVMFSNGHPLLHHKAIRNSPPTPPCDYMHELPPPLSVFQVLRSHSK
jgi:hypothetical protein